MKTEDLPALPEPAVWRARGQIWSLAELHRQGLIDEADGLFSAEQVISYAAQSVAAERERCETLLDLQQASHEREIQIEVAAERERCVKLRTVADQVLRDMQAQEVLPEWQTLLDEALRA